MLSLWISSKHASTKQVPKKSMMYHHFIALLLKNACVCVRLLEKCCTTEATHGRKGGRAVGGKAMDGSKGAARWAAG
jgi:hypothetical protein